MNPRTLALALSVLLAAPLTANAAAKVKIDDDTNLEVGLRLQTQLFSTETNLDADPEYERKNDFLIRRARVRFRVNHKSWFTAYVQTDYEEQAGTSSDLRVIDAYLLLKPSPLVQFYIGQNMAPASRPNLTSSGAFMTVDRPGLTYKTLTWGPRYKYGFTNNGYLDSRLRTQAKAPVRDLGVTLFGNYSFTEAAHLKYYLGAYDGVQTAQEDNVRITGRVQLNFLGKESGYYNDATYLGEKKTVGIGASYDTQNAVALDQVSTSKQDYKLYNFDAFAEIPVGGGSISAEAGYMNLDLGDGGTLLPGTPIPATAAQVQGDGFYANLGFYVQKFQPWVQYEAWTSDDSADQGSFKVYRAGVNYYLKGHDLKVVAGWERFEPDVQLSGTQDTVQSFVLGLYADL